jgi:sugar lactone lactonase YvrE
LIWRVDLPYDGGKATARVWLKHDSMGHDPNDITNQPGVNGLGFPTKANYLYYTSTNQKLVMQVRIDAATHDPAGAPEFHAGGMMGDGFCIDENAGVAYVATHRQNIACRWSRARTAK